MTRDEAAYGLITDLYAQNRALIAELEQLRQPDVPADPVEGTAEAYLAAHD